jgi:hypothetical protein
MTTGDINAKTIALTTALRRINFPAPLDLDSLHENAVLFSIIKFTVLRFDANVTQLAVDRGFFPQGLHDLQFAKEFLKFARHSLGLRPVLTAQQILEDNVYLERKLMLVTDFITASQQYAIVANRRQKLHKHAHPDHQHHHDTDNRVKEATGNCRHHHPIKKYGEIISNKQSASSALPSASRGPPFAKNFTSSSTSLPTLQPKQQSYNHNTPVYSSNFNMTPLGKGDEHEPRLLPPQILAHKAIWGEEEEEGGGGIKKSIVNGEVDDFQDKDSVEMVVEKENDISADTSNINKDIFTTGAGRVEKAVQATSEKGDRRENTPSTSSTKMNYNNNKVHDKHSNQDHELLSDRLERAEKAAAQEERARQRLQARLLLLEQKLQTAGNGKSRGGAPADYAVLNNGTILKEQQVTRNHYTASLPPRIQPTAAYKKLTTGELIQKMQETLKHAATTLNFSQSCIK